MCPFTCGTAAPMGTASVLRRAGHPEGRQRQEKCAYAKGKQAHPFSKQLPPLEGKVACLAAEQDTQKQLIDTMETVFEDRNVAHPSLKPYMKSLNPNHIYKVKHVKKQAHPSSNRPP